MADDNIVPSPEILASKRNKLDIDGGYIQTKEEYLSDAEEEDRCSDASDTDTDTETETEIDEELVAAAAAEEAKIAERYKELYDNLRSMTPEEYEEYEYRVGKSGGFDAPYFPNTGAIGKIEPILGSDDMNDDLEGFSRLALAQYNQDNKSNYQLKKVVKANRELVAGFLYYITFEATDDDKGLQNFQAEVWEKIGREVEISFCRKEISETK